MTCPPNENVINQYKPRHRQLFRENRRRKVESWYRFQVHIPVEKFPRNEDIIIDEQIFVIQIVWIETVIIILIIKVAKIDAVAISQKQTILNASVRLRIALDNNLISNWIVYDQMRNELPMNTKRVPQKFLPTKLCHSHAVSFVHHYNFGQSCIVFPYAMFAQL